MDANAKIGLDYIKGDPYEMSANGKLLISLIERQDLVIINGTDKCFGLITRMRKKGNTVEKSILDYFIVCRALFQMVTMMVIDEDRDYILTKYSKCNGKTKLIVSDHNPLKLEVNISWSMKIVQERQEIYNLRNKECQNIFFQNTNNSDILTRSLINKDIMKGGKLWIKNLKYMIMQSFRKIRMNKKNKQSNKKNK